MTDRLVAGRFQIAEALGHGGMGTVWRAEDQLLGRVVALKEVHIPSTLPESERKSLRERVIREARAAAKLSHPAAVTVYDVLEEDDNVYIAMELVESPTLNRIVEEEGPFTPQRAARTALAVLDALEVAHANGIIHRDVKPGNIMVGKEGRIKLADFGVASIKGDPRLTATGMVIGSPSYMSPEQATGLPAEPSSDLWGLGATLFFATEGKGPFDRPGPIPTLMAITKEDPPPPEHAGPLKAVIGSLLSKDPDDRPGPEQLRPILQRVAANGSAAAAPAPAIAPAPEGEPLHDAAAADEDVQLRDAEETEPLPAQGAEPTLREELIAASAPRRAAVQVQRPERAVEVRPRTPPPRVPTRPSGRSWGLPIAVGVALLLAILLVPRLLGGGSSELEDPVTSDPPTGTAADPTGGSPAGEAKQGQEPTVSEESGSLPRGWQRQAIGGTGYSIGRPSDWRVVSNPIGDGSSMRFEGPEGKYLLVDWTDQPGEDAAAAWEQQAAGYAQRHRNYNEIRIEPTTFGDFPTAAIWEWTYTERGADLHAANLGFANDDWGFALNFQTRSADWEESRATFERFQETFTGSDDDEED